MNDTTTNNLIYRRVLLKLSGEALQGNDAAGISPKILEQFASDIKVLVELGVEIGLVIGGGNLFRGAALSEAGLDRVTGDYMGMLATMMNALAMRDALERLNIPTYTMSALPINGVIEPFDRREAVYQLSQKKVVLFSAGIGSPYFTTDSAASLRAVEINADILLKATKVDGIYNADPILNKSAKRYECLSYNEVIEKNLKVMDATAICLCRDHNMLIRVFDSGKPNVLKKIVLGEPEGTLVQEEK
ncbi:MAG: UMP kinase [Legionellales bacterium]|nr:UMP kinase [Legionellales bacterium]